MKHLEFCNKIDFMGVNIRANNIENKERIFDCSTDVFGTKIEKVIKQKNFKLISKTNPDDDLLKMLLKKAIDCGTWKHSLHIDIVPENYDKIKNIIQEKIINKSIEIDELLAIYFQMQYDNPSD